MLSARPHAGSDLGGEPARTRPGSVTPADLGARLRLDAAFAREERRGLMLAAAARSIAVLLIVGWIAAVNPERGMAFAWVIGGASFFLVTGLAQFWLYWRNLAPPATPYAFVLVESLALAALILAPNLALPPDPAAAPPQSRGGAAPCLPVIGRRSIRGDEAREAGGRRGRGACRVRGGHEPPAVS